MSPRKSLSTATLLVPLLAACGTSKPSASSASASASAAASVSVAVPAPPASASATSSVGVAVPAPPALGKPGDGFATAEEGAAAVAHAVASERLDAFDVGTPSKQLVDSAFTECSGKPATEIARDMKLGVQDGLKRAKGKRPLKAMRLVEAGAIALKKGESYADCMVAKDLQLRVFGFLIHDADGNDAFADGGLGVSFYALGEPPRYYISAPK